MKIVIATDNAHKLIEYRRMLEPLGFCVLSKREVLVDLVVEETADTFLGNARQKAEAIFRQVGLPTLADDSGLVVDALDGAPGVYSSRYGGEALSDEQRCDLVLKKLEGVPRAKRTARFVCALYLILDDLDHRSYEAYCEGFILSRKMGENGFGYDPVFTSDDQVSFAMLQDHKKDQISHRAKALRLLQTDLATQKKEA